MISTPEKWEWVSGYNGLYQISNLGRVCSVKRPGSKGGLLKPRKDSDGYLMVMLWSDGIPTNKKIHRLVAQAFIPNSEDKPQVNHLNGNKADNSVSNLEWATPSENVLHAYPGTTWLRVAEGVTMRSAKADGSDLGTVVGSDTATLAVENLPAHAHNIGGSTGSGGSATITSGAYDFASISTSNTGAHTHTYTYMADTGDSGENDSDGTPITKSSTGTTSSSGAHAHTMDLPSHTHSVSVPAHTHTLPAATQSAGSGTAFNIIPHSMIVNIWERTA